MTDDPNREDLIYFVNRHFVAETPRFEGEEYHNVYQEDGSTALTDEYKGSGEVDSSSGEEPSSPAVVCPRPLPRRRNSNVLTSTDSSGSSSYSLDSSSSGPRQIPKTPLERAAHE